MCCYCQMGDSWFRHDPPFQIDPQRYPSIPQPIVPMPAFDWSFEKLSEYLRLLKEVKEMEDKLGCPCEPNKVDYIKFFEERLEALKKIKATQ